MKYYKQYKEANAEVCEITKSDARRTLEGWWREDFLDDIFKNEKQFRLYTGYAHVWTQAENGLTPVAGFIGVCE